MTARLVICCYSLTNCTECLAILQEEEEAQAKADKIKMALEKLKEAKVKKVNYDSVLQEEVELVTAHCA